MAALINNSVVQVPSIDSFQVNEECVWLQIACATPGVTHCWLSKVGIDKAVLIALPASFEFRAEDPANDEFAFSQQLVLTLNTVDADPIALSDPIVYELCALDFMPNRTNIMEALNG